MKKTLMALAMTAGVLGCDFPRKTDTLGNDVVVVPNECTKIKDFSITRGPRYNLMCDDAKGNPIYFFSAMGNSWTKYEFVYPNGEKVTNTYEKK
jgi:hypothetical protein